MITLMASMSMTSIIFLFLLCQVLLSLASQSSPSGMTLELIPPYSPKSPLFNGNLTFAERRQRLVQQSRARVQYFSAILSASTSSNDSESLQPEMITPPIIRLFTSSMVVEVGIGTINGGGSSSHASYKSYLLVLDTGSALTWTQCEGCKPSNCYLQKEEPFPNSQSKSYVPLPCNNHSLCTNQCIGDHCSYSVKYMDGASSSGILAKETFTFPSSSSSRGEAVQGIVFGCGLKNVDPQEKEDYQIAGVFGLGQGDRSFVQQIEQRSGGRFSYCLVADVKDPPPMHLRFGSDIKPPKNLQTTGLFTRGRSEAYFVTLRDLGVDGKPLQIDPKVFDPPDDRKGGCAVDSGSSFSYIIEAAYQILVKQLETHFSKLAEFTRDTTQESKLCYKRDKVQGYNKIPAVNFYFEDARLDVSPEGTFEREVLRSGKERFCLQMESDPNLTMLGAFQQVNFKFIYDTKLKKLHFGPEDCAKNG